MEDIRTRFIYTHGIGPLERPLHCFDFLPCTTKFQRVICDTSRASLSHDMEIINIVKIFLVTILEFPVQEKVVTFLSAVP